MSLLKFSICVALVLLECTVHIYGTAQGGCSGTTIWEKFTDIKADSGTYTAAGDADEATCFAQCKDVTTCYAWDYDSTQSTKCYIHETENLKIGDSVGINHYRKRTIVTCPTAYYYGVSSCQVYELWGYQGMFPYDTQTVTSGSDVSTCISACEMDSLNCVAFDYDHVATADNCRLYATEYAFDIMTVGETSDDAHNINFYYYDVCGGLRDSATQGFHLHAEYQAAAAATTTAGGTFNECWDSCFGSLTCPAFGWIDSSSSCVIYDDTTVNTTVATAGTFHHVLFTDPNYSGGGSPPAVSYTDPTENCFKLSEWKIDTRSIRATMLDAGNANTAMCAEECRALGSGCAAFDYVDSTKPFKSNRCYYYATTPTVTFGQTDRHEYLVDSSSSTCPTSSGSTSADDCTWLQYDGIAGFYDSGFNETSATTNTACFTACVAAGYGCGAVDFTTDSVCILYPAFAAYFYVDATTVTHYVRTACT